VKEFSANIEKALIAGLRKDKRSVVNSPALTVCKNVKPTDFGLKPQEVMSAVTFSDATPTISYPYPQVFKGTYETIVVDASNIWTAIITGSDLALTALSLVKYDDLSTAETITVGTTPWQFVDFGKCWALYNGSCVAFKYPTDLLSYDTANVVRVQKAVTVKAGCAFRGRHIMAGFDKTNFWLGGWSEFWKSWINDIDEAPEFNFSPTSDAPDKNFVHWTSIGGGDTFWLYYPELMFEGFIGKDSYTRKQTGRGRTDPLIFDYMQRNEWGFMPMPFQGAIQNVIPLGNGVVAFGDDGVTALPHVTEPFPTFGTKHLMSMGIKSQGAVGYSDNMAIFIDKEGTLWAISPDYQLSRLGYKEFLSGLSTPAITYNTAEQDFHIVDDNQHFVLTPQGLSENTISIPTSVFIDGANTLMANSTETNLVQNPTFDTDTANWISYHGTHAGQLLFTQSEGRAFIYGVFNISEIVGEGISQGPITVTDGQTYTASFDFDKDGAASDTVYLSITESSTDPTSTPLLSASNNTDDTGTLSGTFTAGSNPVYIFLYFLGTVTKNAYWYMEDVSIRIGTPAFTPDQKTVITTDVLDFGHRGIKTIQWIEVGCNTSNTNLSALIHYRFDKNSSYSSSASVPLNDEGYGFLAVAGIDFKVEVQSTEYLTTDIDYINVKYKTTDKRFIRGIYGSQVNA